MTISQTQNIRHIGPAAGDRLHGILPSCKPDTSVRQKIDDHLQTAVRCMNVRRIVIVAVHEKSEHLRIAANPYPESNGPCRKVKRWMEWALTALLPADF